MGERFGRSFLGWLFLFAAFGHLGLLGGCFRAVYSRLVDRAGTYARFEVLVKVLIKFSRPSM